MKNTLIITSLIISLIACSKKESTQEQPSVQTYGESFDQKNVKDITNLSDLMSESDSVALTLSGTIEKTCAVKGCWMQLQTGSEKSLRVTFKNYSFFVPKSGAEDKKAIIKGYCLRQETSVEELRHYAKDAGENEEAIALITEPKMEYNFVASGVIIED